MTAAPDFQRVLEQGAAALGLELDADQQRRLLAHLALIERWNKVYNLTAVRDPAQMLVQHLLDSLSVIAPLRRHTGGAAAAVLDVGSGAGLPGVTIAVACPELAVSCVDTVAKKASFIRQVAAELPASNLRALHARVEALDALPWQIITARAFSSLADLVLLTRPLLAPGGVWMAMKGQHPAEEIAALPADIDVFHVEQLRVPNLNAERCLIWMKQRENL
ncbi:16S rRNA (guanine(527)-N(7))-methyltransferase RsmG [Rivibacter subsaxonicus]|uniref:Ribosomal RNA small subunit methyltransferase G n=1 Tax=Rivibacter subsaxonicus TaxID=457575 RepID=A0A4Q7VWK5_9BURK|nr:16S rRNA (guanine(527)-N(7))-methyltransferase RsmG [Rivibacter subsaxonicus]RZU00865.1 16S rRNA m(7)G-527 methyltransferase [Rivibacter subsaxonicus]